MATSVDAVAFVEILVDRFVAVADVERAALLLGAALVGVAFFVAARPEVAARLDLAGVVALGSAFVDLAGAAVAFFEEAAALALVAVPAAFAVLRVVADDFTAALDAGVRDEVADAFVVARFVGRAALAADALVAVVTFAARGVPDRDARPPRPTAAMAIPSRSLLNGHCWLSRSPLSPAKAAKDTS